MAQVKRNAFFLIFLIVLPAISSGCDSSKELPAELQRDIGTVTLEIDFGDQKPSKSIDVVCSPDSTVLLSLERAQQMNKLKFKVTGSGETAFLDSIDDVSNEVDQGKYWTYRVNDSLGDKSAGVFAVKPADKITWTFGDRPKELE
jgi:hypothetical protein